MKNITAKVDRQATMLLDLTFWSNAVVLLFIVVINVINLARVSLGQTALLTTASPQMVLLVSFAIILYLGYNSFNALAIKRRLLGVSFTMDETGVTGTSLPNPAISEQGETFSVPFSQIVEVSIVEVSITRKHTAPSLKIETAERAYYVPAPEGLKELVREIAEQMGAK
ncbi:MAG: hypothetical protein PHW41_01485 [Eubacteriales bacterium]|nr:hypothetical protein [Eubacteriales bacterium]